MNGLNVTVPTEPNEQTSGKPLTQSTLPTDTLCPCDSATSLQDWIARQAAHRLRERMAAAIAAIAQENNDVD